ncbi:hypothetical protein C8R43DRAFT_1234061 [Mycena crocata]|nr:hypothetical protein C8R43DRAFT_1234061 [Mycena crocata]
MPEKAIYKLFEREVGWEERQVSSKVNRDDDSAFFGNFVTHPECCARVTGHRQTFTVHISSPNDENFIDLPLLSPPTPLPEDAPPRPPHYCGACHRGYTTEASGGDFSLPASVIPRESATPAAANDVPAKYVNKLKIRGRISALARGKELLVAICNPQTEKNFLFRVTFCLEGHCFWIPTEWYHRITSSTPVSRGEKSFAFPIPDEYIDGPLSDRIISIQAAFIRPKWTLIFVDHNVMIQLHLMQMSSVFTRADIAPKSAVWERLWNANHGPVYSQEPEETLKALEDWRARIRRFPKRKQPIFAAIKNTQTVFNGSGAQEGTDLVNLAFLHPQMPSFQVCNNDELWARLVKAVIDYDKNRIELALPEARLPYASGAMPFRMNYDGHKHFLSNITIYRREFVIFTEERLSFAIDLGLFQPNAEIQPDGRAIVPAGSAPCEPSVEARFRADRNQATVQVPNICVSIQGGRKSLNAYSPFTAKPGSGWKMASRSMVTSDVRDDVNETTLGLYSFRIFVDCAWTAQKVAKTMEGLPRGPRPTVHAGRSNRKRPLAADIARSAAPKRKKGLQLGVGEN